MDFAKLLQEGKSKKLKPTATIVRGRNGKIAIEREELLSSKEKEARVATSARAGKLRKGLPKHLVEKQSNPWPIPSGEMVEFDDQKSCWVPANLGTTDVHLEVVEASSHQTEAPADAATSIRLVSYNVWFSEYKWEARLDALLDLIFNKEQANVICLQEVTPHFLSKLLHNSTARRHFQVVTGYSAWYGICMLVAKSLVLPIVNYDVLPLPTRMGRMALIVRCRQPCSSTLEADTNNATNELAIATVHLESLNSRETRSQQLKLIHQALASSDAALLVGDWNITATGDFGDVDEHRHSLAQHMPRFVDLWTRLHGTDADQEGSPRFAEGLTFDTQDNTMLRASTRFFERSRLDRACMKESAAWKGGNIRVVGKEAIPGSSSSAGSPLYVSDHYGLSLDICFSK